MDLVFRLGAATEDYRLRCLLIGQDGDALVRRAQGWVEEQGATLEDALAYEWTCLCSRLLEEA